MQQHRFDSDGVQINVVDWRTSADQTPLFCIHGITANARGFDPIAAGVAPEHGAIAPDLRGRGESDKPDGPYGIAAHVGDMVAVLDGLGLERVAVAGWSLGSLVTLHLAARHPERVERAILLDPPGLDINDMARASLGRVQGRLSNTYPDMDAAVAYMRGTPLFTGVWDAGTEAYVRADLQEGPNGAVHHRMPIDVLEKERNAQVTPLIEILPDVTCPVLILRATDTLFQPGDELLSAKGAKRMTELLPRGRTVDIPGTNHYTITLGRPTATIAAIREFLAEPVE
jgi:pimeloyl-ACP methyl ester carboxylesterase